VFAEDILKNKPHTGLPVDSS